MESYRKQIFYQLIQSGTGLLLGNKNHYYTDEMEGKFLKARQMPKFINCWLKVNSYLRNQETFYIVEYACGRLYFHSNGYTTNSLLRIMHNDLVTSWAKRDYKKQPRIGDISLILETEA